MIYYLVCELMGGFEIIEVEPDSIEKYKYSIFFRFSNTEKIKLINKLSGLIIGKSCDVKDKDVVFFTIKDVINDEFEWSREYIFETLQDAEKCVKRCLVESVIE